MKRNVPAVRSLLVLGLVYSTGCATINTHVDPWAIEAGVRAGAPVMLRGDVEGLKVYVDDQAEPLKIVIVNDPTFRSSLGNATREAIAQGAANASPGGTATYEQRMPRSPAVYVSQKKAHRLHIVRRDGSQKTVIVKPHVGMKYLVVDWLLTAPTLGASVLIDWGTGKWRSFDDINLEAEFRGVSP